jgi:hypothetical protein
LFVTVFSSCKKRSGHSNPSVKAMEEQFSSHHLMLACHWEAANGLAGLEKSPGSAKIEHQWQTEVCDDRAGNAPKARELGKSTHRKVLKNFVRLTCTPGKGNETKQSKDDKKGSKAKHHLTAAKVTAKDEDEKLVHCCPETSFAGTTKLEGETRDTKLKEETREWVVALCISRQLQLQTCSEDSKEAKGGT